MQTHIYRNLWVVLLEKPEKKQKVEIENPKNQESVINQKRNVVKHVSNKVINHQNTHYFDDLWSTKIEDNKVLFDYSDKLFLN